MYEMRKPLQRSESKAGAGCLNGPISAFGIDRDRRKRFETQKKKHFEMRKPKRAISGANFFVV